MNDSTTQPPPLTPLTGKQRAHLRSLGHNLKPLLQVGKGGLTESFFKQLRQALSQHELMKVKLIQNAALSLPEAAMEIERATPCQVAQQIGKTLLLYLPHPKDPKITLP